MFELFDAYSVQCLTCNGIKLERRPLFSHHLTPFLYSTLTSPPNPTGRLLPPFSGKIAITLYIFPIPPPPLSTNLSTPFLTCLSFSSPPACCCREEHIISERSLAPMASSHAPCSTGPCTSTPLLAARAASASAVKSTSALMST